MKHMKREAILFFAIFLILAVGMHFSAWITHPIEHLEALPSSPLGPWHPLYITAGVYLLLWPIRLAWRGVRSFIKKRKGN